MERPRGSRLAASSWIAAAAVAVVAGILGRRALRGEGVPSLDVYEYSLPIFHYAQTALHQGHGLLWNDLLSCGQPFFAIPSTALLYPPNLLFLPFDARVWLFGQSLINLLVAGAGAYALARALRLGRGAAIGAALAFQLGGTSVGLASWFPQAQGSYVWIPAALACVERILRAPRGPAAVALAAVLALQLLAGYPQMLVFTLELIGLRVLYELVTRRRWSRVAGLRCLAVGLLLPPVFTAVQLLPASEVLADSVRTLPMTPKDLLAGHAELSWQGFRELVGRQAANGGSLSGLLPAVGSVLAAAALGCTRRWRVAGFYLLVTVLFLALIFDSPLRDAYRMLPIAGALRNPLRFGWVASFSLSVLVGFGIEALGRGRPRLALAGVIGAAAGLAWLLPSGLGVREWGLVAGVVAIGLRGARAPSGAVGSSALIAVLAIDLLAFSWQPFLSYLWDEDVLRRAAPAMAIVRERTTPQFRVYPVPGPGGLARDLSLGAKSTVDHGLPSIYDYEHLTSRRFAELYVRMTTGRRLRTAGDWIRAYRKLPRIRGLFDLLATRWAIGRRAPPRRLGLERVWSQGDLEVWENPGALPRAFYVPVAEIVSDPEERLERLASAGHDPRRVALLDAAPADGFLGVVEGRGAVSIETARSEELVVRVEATRAGFLFVSDQYQAGWSAEVDGTPATILRANHAFRLVRVPAGVSRVRFRYRPRSLVAGAGISFLSIGSTVAWAVRRRRGRGAGP